MKTPAHHGPSRRRDDDALILRALKALEKRMDYGNPILGSPQTVKDFLRLRLGLYEREAFLAIWLDTQHRLIQVEELFRGTVTQTSVHPREVVKSGLAVNASGVLLAHNHTSGNTEPSRADINLTEVLQQTLALVDIRVLDHLIVGSADVMSFAERGLL